MHATRTHSLVADALFTSAHAFFLYVFEITLYDLGGVVCTASSLYRTLCIAHTRMLLYIFILLSSLVSHFVTRQFLVPPCALDDRDNLI